MKIALHGAPEGFFKSTPPHSNSELLRLVQKADSLGFKCFEIGPLWSFEEIDAKSLRSVLDGLGMERSVHVGGLYDAMKFALTEKEGNRFQKELHSGIQLCGELSSQLVSFHPPFFTTNSTAPQESELLSNARTRFLKLVKQEVEFASKKGIQIALESFCYPPFTFAGLHDFMQFVSRFPSTKLGVLLETGHLFQMGFNLDESVHMFRDRILDVHVHDATLEGDVQKTTHLPIGSGNIDFTGLISALRKVKYNGWLTLEINGDERKIIESKAHLEKLIRITT